MTNSQQIDTAWITPDALGDRCRPRFRPGLGLVVFLALLLLAAALTNTSPAAARTVVHGIMPLARTGSIGNDDVDNTVPSIDISEVNDGQQINIVEQAGPSGMASLKCTENGVSVTPTQVEDDTTGVDFTQTAWTLDPFAFGSVGVSCVATGNNGLSSPVASFADSDNIEGSWTTGTQTVKVTIPTGTRLNGCDLFGDNDGLPLGNGVFTATANGGTETISGPGIYSLSCDVVSDSGLIASNSTYAVWIADPTAQASVTPISVDENEGVTNDDALIITMPTAYDMYPTVSDPLTVWLQEASGGPAIPITCQNGGPAQDVYEIFIPDGELVPGTYRLFAQPYGGQAVDLETLTLPLTTMTALTFSAGGVSGAQLAATPLAIVDLQGDIRGSHVAKHSRLSTALAQARSSHGGTLHTNWRAQTLFTGKLTYDNGKRPLANTAVFLYKRIAGSSTLSTVGWAITGRKGGWSLRKRTGPSGTYFASWSGNGIDRGATSELDVASTATVTFVAGQPSADHVLHMTGKVLGGYIPKSGVAITLYYQEVGAAGAGILKSFRTRPNGMWSFNQPFASYTKGLKYRFWAVAGPTPGWPFATTKSSVIVRTVG